MRATKASFMNSVALTIDETSMVSQGNVKREG